MVSFLLVDDSATVLLALRHAIRQARPDAQVHEAADMNRAMKLFEEKRPGVVLMDMVLPDDEPEPAPGEEAPDSAGLRLVRQMLARTPTTSILLVTGLPASHPDVMAAVSLGVVGMMRKPVRPDDVKAALGALFPDDDALSYIR